MQIPKSAGQIGERLKQKVGPLAVWQWAAIGGVAFFLFSGYLFKRNSGSNQQNADASLSSGVGIPAAPQQVIGIPQNVLAQPNDPIYIPVIVGSDKPVMLGAQTETGVGTVSTGGGGSRLNLPVPVKNVTTTITTSPLSAAYQDVARILAPYTTQQRIQLAEQRTLVPIQNQQALIDAEINAFNSRGTAAKSIVDPARTAWNGLINASDSAREAGQRERPGTD